jgi:hypothetical protein
MGWGGVASGGTPWAMVASLAQNRAEGMGILTRGSLMVGRASRRRCHSPIFLLVVGYFQGINSTPAQPSAAAAPPKACRVLQLPRKLVEDRAHGWLRVLVLAVQNSGFTGDYL